MDDDVEQLRIMFVTNLSCLGDLSFGEKNTGKYDCSLCKSKFDNIAILHPCYHELCTKCLDNEYDNHGKYNGLFDCPYCKMNVIDYSYKST